MARRRNRKSEQMGLPLLLFVGLQAFLVYRLPGYGAVFGALCILAAGLAILFIGQLRRRAIRRWQSIGSLYALSQTDFERHVAETYRYLGYATEMTPRVGDQGVDILAQRHRCRLAVQCKRYADPAPNSAVQAVHAGKTHYGCNEATVICLGGFSTAAKELAATTGVKLIDGAQYADMMTRVGLAAVNYWDFVPRGRALLFVAGLVLVGVLSLVMNRGQ